MWTSNPNQFVEDEDDDTFSFSVRIAAQDVLLVSELLYLSFYSFVSLIISQPVSQSIEYVVGQPIIWSVNQPASQPSVSR